MGGGLSISNLPVGQAQNETVELRRQLDLARQPAVRAALGGRAVEQSIFVVAIGGRRASQASST